MRKPFQPLNHALVYKQGNKRTHCPKCKSPRVDYPCYPTDYFDCMDCDHSWSPTEKQIEIMRNGLTEKQLKNCN